MRAGTIIKRRFQACCWYRKFLWNVLFLIILLLDNRVWRKKNQQRQRSAGMGVSSFIITTTIATTKTTPPALLLALSPLSPSPVVPFSGINYNNNFQVHDKQQQYRTYNSRRKRQIVISKSTTRTRTRTTKLYSLSSSSSTTTSSSYVTEELQVDLSTGVSMQVLLCQPIQQQQQQQLFVRKNNVLLFLHGSFHGAWCWMEYWGPYFAERGYVVVASSWRGTAGTYAGDNIKKVKIRDHINDLQSLLQQLPSVVLNTNEAIKPIVITHSFGGIVLMKYLEELYRNEPTNANSIKDTFSGIVSICSVPPSGNGKMTMRFVQRSFVDSYKITVGFAMKKCITNANLCRDLFFGGPVVRDPITGVSIDDYGVSDEQIQIYQQRFEQDSKATIDLLDLAKQLPSANVDKNGVAPFTSLLPPTTVMGATADFIVDTIGNQETATYYNIDTPIYIDSPHDIMLGSKWENGATILYDWIQNHIE